jgi:AraC family transcriptional regulator
MNIQDSRSEYVARMHRVLAYIDKHLGEPIELAQLAEVANFSAFHFHRLFYAWAGESTADFVRRRRLESAASHLSRFPRTPILDLALDVGFGSSEAFSRAFKTHFGITPSGWKNISPGEQKSKLDQMMRNLNQAFAHHSQENGTTQSNPPEPPMNVTIIQRQDVPIAYLRHVGPYGASVGEFWQREVMPWMTANNLFSVPRYGISHDDPSVTAPEKCRYDACAEAGQDQALVGNALRTVIPGGRYASLQFYGPNSQIMQAWHDLIFEWLPRSGLQMDNRPCFEYYPVNGRFDAQTGDFECAICIPVVAL